MISATAWVPRGFASEFPEQYELNDEEMERIEAMSKLNLSEAKADLEEAEEEEGIEIQEESTINSNKLKDQIDIDGDLKEYDFEHYDDEDGETGEKIVMFPGLTNSRATYIKKIKKGVNGEEDQEMIEGVEIEDDDAIPTEEEHYLQLPSKEEELEQEVELQIYPTDNLILSTRTEDEVSYLDVYVYDDGAGALGPDDETEAEEEKKYDADVKRGMVREGNLYIHHDLMLPSFPLCVEWMSFKPNGENDVSNVGNFAAIGTFEPTIELWNLDCIDKAFPDVILGENEYAEWSLKNNGKSKKGKKKKTNKINSKCHTDAVVSLCHNRIFRNVLCSTSADSTVKLWDLTKCKVERSIDNGLHNGKTVSNSMWLNNNGTNDEQGGSILLTGGYDGFMKISDVRLEDVIGNCKSFSCGAEYGEEIESINKIGENYIIGGCDSGNVYCYDIRMDGGSNVKPLWTLHAHDSGISTLSSNSGIPGLIVTGAMGEKAVKVWNVKDNKPRMILSKDFGCGNVLSTSFADELEVSGNLVIGGSSNSGLKMWDVFSNNTVNKSFTAELKDLQNRAIEEAKKYGRVSRIARKYRKGYGESVVEPEVGGLEDSEEAEDEEE